MRKMLLISHVIITIIAYVVRETHIKEEVKHSFNFHRNGFKEGLY